MKLSGLPSTEVVFELNFIARDSFLNRAEDKVRVVVRK